MILSWILSTLVAIVGLLASCAILFLLAIVFDELCKFRVVRFIVKIVVPTIAIAVIVAVVGAGATFIHRAWVAHREKTQPKAAIVGAQISVQPTPPPEAVVVDAVPAAPVKTRIIEHIVDGTEHRWFEYDGTSWHTFDLTNGGIPANASLTTYVRGGDGKYYLSDPPATPTNDSGVNTEGMGQN